MTVAYKRGDVVTIRMPWETWSLWDRLVYRWRHRGRRTSYRDEQFVCVQSTTAVPTVLFEPVWGGGATRKPRA
jgi:hypothetical protein